MKNFELAKEKALEGGYKPKVWAHISDKEKLLDPDWWSCLGKALGWINSMPSTYNFNTDIPEYKHHWHNLIEWIIAGKDIDSFFNGLLQNK